MQHYLKFSFATCSYEYKKLLNKFFKAHRVLQTATVWIVQIAKKNLNMRDNWGLARVE